MKTTFEQLQVGQRFHYNIDADGHEPYLYKLNATEAYVEHGSHSGLRETVDPEAEVWTWGETVVLHDAPTEIERAALTILLQRQQDHIGLRCYIRALASDAAEIRDLDRYIWEAEVDDDGERAMVPVRTLCAERGQVCWQRKYDRDHRASGAIIDNRPTGRQPQSDDEHYIAWQDEIDLRLASAIQSYREAGRANGDQTSTISGMGGPLLNVMTSLAAAIAEHHAAMINVWASRLLDAE